MIIYRYLELLIKIHNIKYDNFGFQVLVLINEVEKLWYPFILNRTIKYPKTKGTGFGANATML